MALQVFADSHSDEQKPTSIPEEYEQKGGKKKTQFLSSLVPSNLEGTFAVVFSPRFPDARGL